MVRANEGVIAVWALLTKSTVALLRCLRLQEHGACRSCHRGGDYLLCAVCVKMASELPIECLRVGVGTARACAACAFKRDS